MLQVTNGKVTLTVTKGAFNAFYVHKGFQAVNGESGQKKAPGVLIPETVSKQFSEHSTQLRLPEERKKKTLAETPLSALNFEQLKSYADILGISHDRIRSKKELRALIRQALHERRDENHEHLK